MSFKNEEDGVPEYRRGRSVTNRPVQSFHDGDEKMLSFDSAMVPPPSVFQTFMACTGMDGGHRNHDDLYYYSRQDRSWSSSYSYSDDYSSRSFDSYDRRDERERKKYRNKKEKKGTKEKKDKKSKKDKKKKDKSKKKKSKKKEMESRDENAERQRGGIFGGLSDRFGGFANLGGLSDRFGGLANLGGIGNNVGIGTVTLLPDLTQVSTGSILLANKNGSASVLNAPVFHQSSTSAYDPLPGVAPVVVPQSINGIHPMQTPQTMSNLQPIYAAAQPALHQSVLHPLQQNMQPSVNPVQQHIQHPVYSSQTIYEPQVQNSMSNIYSHSQLPNQNTVEYQSVGPMAQQNMQVSEQATFQQQQEADINSMHPQPHSRVNSTGNSLRGGNFPGTTAATHSPSHLELRQPSEMSQGLMPVGSQPSQRRPMGENIHHGMNHINNSNRSNKSDGLQGDIQSSSLLNLTSKQGIVEGCGKTRNKGNPHFDDKDFNITNADQIHRGSEKVHSSFSEKKSNSKTSRKSLLRRNSDSPLRKKSGSQNHSSSQKSVTIIESGNGNNFSREAQKSNADKSIADWYRSKSLNPAEDHGYRHSVSSFNTRNMGNVNTAKELSHRSIGGYDLARNELSVRSLSRSLREDQYNPSSNTIANPQAEFTAKARDFASSESLSEGQGYRGRTGSMTEMGRELEPIMSKNAQFLQNGTRIEEMGFYHTKVPPGDMGVTLIKTAEGLMINHQSENSIATELIVGDYIVSIDGVDMAMFSSHVVTQLLTKRKSRVRSIVFKRPLRDQPPDMPGNKRNHNASTPLRETQDAIQSGRSSTPLKSRNLSQMREKFLKKRDSQRSMRK